MQFVSFTGKSKNRLGLNSQMMKVKAVLFVHELCVLALLKKVCVENNVALCGFSK